MESRYLHRLPVWPAAGDRTAISSDSPPSRLGPLLAALALLSISSVTAIAFVRWGARPQNQAAPGWPASGCLSANLEPLAAQVVVRRLSLCGASDGIHGVVDIDRLEPNARYFVWVIYRGNGCPNDHLDLPPSIQSSSLAGRPDDMGRADPLIVRSLAQRTSDSSGGFHVDEPVRSINLAPHSYVCLVVAPPQWSPVPHPAYRLIDNDASPAVARGVFDIP